ncbi:hypothetical protein [Streptomyces sp. TS71-3]|uniref:hypothetical protein n=1 Tax=Streptomyces sp. TS71-3 TaxID=2733862 RepID=UPI001B27073D|nr:hypothetical protein [Streptomyces sp. TS71-3]GHJ39163.1 hypothetical protein Sm713_47720 [Streptomyces sp. TS71-3]
MSAHAKRRRSWPRRLVSAAVHHPVRLLCRVEDELVDCTSFGIAQVLIIGGFAVVVAGWVVLQIARALLAP